MQIVSDTGMDLYLPEHLMPATEIHLVRHTITLDDQTYYSGDTIQSDELQRKLMATTSFPITSQPAAGDFAAMYKKLAAKDPDILSIHMSSGLSGTINAAHAGAEMVPEANVTIVDTKTLSAVLGWQVAAASRALKAGWAKDKIIELIHRIGDASESMYTLNDLKYLIHGGRISHMKGLLASVLRIRPLIGVEKVGGTYSQLGMARTFDKAINSLVELMTKYHTPGTAIHVQVLHALNPEAVQKLRDQIDSVFDCTWMKIGYMSPALAAHTGPTMIGVAFASQSIFNDLP